MASKAGERKGRREKCRRLNGVQVSSYGCQTYERKVPRMKSATGFPAIPVSHK